MRWVIPVLLVTVAITASAQREYGEENHLLSEGRTLFEAGEYAGAAERLEAYRRLTADGGELREVDYMIAFSAFECEYPEALSLLEAYAEAYPDSPHAEETDYLAGCLRFDAAAIDYAMGRYAEATAALNVLKKRHGFDTVAAALLVQIYYIQEEYAEAIREGETLPDEAADAEVHRIVGEAYYRLGNKPQAARRLERYVEGNEEPLRNDVYILGICLFDEGKYPEAVRRFGSITDGEPDSIEQSARLYMGQALLAMGDKQGARVAFEGAARMKGGDERVRETALYNYASLVHETRFIGFGEAIGIFEEFLKDFPTSAYAAKIGEYLTESLFRLGTEAFAAGDDKAALMWLTCVTETGRKGKGDAYLDAYYWRAETYYRLADYPHAAEDYRTYLRQPSRKKEPIYPLACYGLGYCAFKRQDYDAALEAFRQYTALASKEDNAYADALNRTGDCLFHHRRFKEAATAYEQAAAAMPQAGDYALFQKAFIAGLEKDYKAKVAGMDKLLRDYPDSPYADDALYEKGRALVMLNDNRNAAVTFETLMRLYRQSALAPKAGVQIGLIYFNEERLAEAAAAYKRIISDYPSSEEAQTALQDLKAVYVDMNDIDGYTAYISSVGKGIRLEAGEEDSLSYLAAERLFMREADKTAAKVALQHYLDKFPEGAFRKEVLARQTEIAFLETEARLVLAKSLIADGRWEEALPDIEALSEDTHTPQGAEAKYLLAQHWYDTNDDARAIALLEDYAAKGTPHAYWLARSFILWADIYIRQDDPAQARIYLQSLQTNYRGKDDDIPAMITTRLESLK